MKKRKAVKKRRPYGRIVIVTAVCVSLAFLGGLKSVGKHSRGRSAVTAMPASLRSEINYAKNLVSSAQVDSAIELAAAYLVEATGPDGRFEYKVHLDPRQELNDRYNVVRHAGAIYALATYAEKRPREDVSQALKRQSEFLVSNCLGPVEGADDVLAIWSNPKLTHSGSGKVAKLGGTGLGLVGLSAVEAVLPNTTEMAKLQAMARFIVYMQKADGSFYSKCYPAPRGRSDIWTSLYYPGEAALGLVMLYEIDKDENWLYASAKALKFLAHSRKGRNDVEADHWALLATRRLLSYRDRVTAVVSEEELCAHAEQICQSMLQQRAKHHSHSMRYGSFFWDGRTCPTSTRLEGLLAAESFLEPTSLTSQGSVAIQEGIGYLIRTQLTSGKFAGGIPRAYGVHPKDPKVARRRAGEIRIDYVQHALSAMLDYQNRNPRRPNG